jgi:hypothetical protein
MDIEAFLANILTLGALGFSAWFFSPLTGRVPPRR